MIVLAIGAHPDDLEISCAGTLAKLKELGHQVIMCHASSGDKGHYLIPAQELISIRREEAVQAGAAIGSQVISLEMKDGEIYSENAETRIHFIHLMRSVQPDIVITHAPNDYMPDHNAVNRLVFDASFLATLPGFSSEQPILKKVPTLYYMDNLSGADFQPTIYVDITDTYGKKLEMLRKHQSQLVWLKEHDDVDIVEFVSALAKMRGIQAGCAFAEGFIQHMAWTRPNAIRLPV